MEGRGERERERGCLEKRGFTAARGKNGNGRMKGRSEENDKRWSGRLISMGGRREGGGVLG